jgi:NAD(P)-dependent dehydrogenase (short-subunit alcohol dehydrogenase family)
MENILLIGGNSGIGLETLRNLTGEGKNVFVAARKKPKLDAEFNFVEWDVENTKFDCQFLPDNLSGLIYFPGTINLKPFNRISKDDFLKEFQINFFGAVDVIQATLPLLKKNGNSSVVLFSTVAVKMGMPFHAGIASAKGALEGLCKSLAAEYAPLMRFNAIAPSLTNTPLASKLLSSPEKIEASQKRHPLNKIGEPQDLASMASFLLSSKSSFITGQIFTMDGGMSSIKLI